MKYIHPKRIKNSLNQWALRNKLSSNYSHIIRRLIKKVGKEKIRVVFYTNEPQKWSYDSLYREFEKSDYFKPLIVVVPRFRVHKGLDNTRMSLEEQLDFYKKRDYNVVSGYENGEYVDIRTFAPDIFFYLQLAEVPGIDDPFVVSKVALTCYCPYSFQVADFGKDYLQTFHKYLFRYYVVHDITKNRFEQYRDGNSSNCVVVGYPKLDAYSKKRSLLPEKYWKSPEKFKIIYAPHHSFNDTFRFSTFPKTFTIIRELANTADTTWVFKPHPMLKLSILKSGLMNEDEMNKYYESWNEVGRVYDSGDYFDLFQTSDMMITDCSSFLAEYLPSEKPLVRLINEGSCPLDQLGESLSRGFYSVHDKKELYSVFDELVVKKNDYLKKTRKEVLGSLIDEKKPAANKVFDDLKIVLRID